MVEQQPSKLNMRVRFPLPAPEHFPQENAEQQQVIAKQSPKACSFLKLPDFESCPKPREFPYWKPATFFDVELVVFQSVRSGIGVLWGAWFGDGNGKVGEDLGMAGVRTLLLGAPKADG